MKVYVDKLNYDGTIGIATSWSMMRENIQTLEVKWKNNITESALIFPAGRFICSITLTLEMEFIMVFMDFEKDKQRALLAANTYQDEGTQKIFMDVFERVNHTYDERYNEVELVLDKNFIPDFISN
jgi:hypothetical protein